MKTLSLLFFCFVVILYHVFALNPVHSTEGKTGTCGHPNISISYDLEADYLIACDAIIKAKTFFQRCGYDVDTPISLYFGDHITVNNSFLGHTPIYGYFDPRSMSIFISSLTSPFIKNSSKEHFKIDFQPAIMQAEYHRSVVAHEVAHLLAQHNFNLQTASLKPSPKMGHGVQEYIAHVVQFSSMTPALLQRILEQYSSEIAFTSEQQINYLLYACDPEIFAIMSYHHFHSIPQTQQRALLDQIFANGLNPDLAFKLIN